MIGAVDMAPRKSRCADGHHVPSRKSIRVEDADGQPVQHHSRCCRCGHALVKSPITHRWRITGLLG